MTFLTNPTFLHCFQALLSFITIVSMALASEKNSKTWALSLTNQALWLVYIYLTQQYGLLLMNAGMWYFCIRGYAIWNHTQNRFINAVFVQPKDTLIKLFLDDKDHVKYDILEDK